MRFWTEERQAELRHRWKNGELAKDIAAAMGTTKNAVIGARKQYGLPLRCAGRLPRGPGHEAKVEAPRPAWRIERPMPQSDIPWPDRSRLMAGR